MLKRVVFFFLLNQIAYVYQVFVGSCCCSDSSWVLETLIFLYSGEQGWCSGESTRFPPMWNGFKSRRRRHMWVEFVVGSLLCSKRFFSGFSGFPLSSKTNISKFQFDQESGRQRATMWLCNLQIIIYLFFYYTQVGCVNSLYYLNAWQPLKGLQLVD